MSCWFWAACTVFAASCGKSTSSAIGRSSAGKAKDSLAAAPPVSAVEASATGTGSKVLAAMAMSMAFKVVAVGSSGFSEISSAAVAGLPSAFVGLSACVAFAVGSLTVSFVFTIVSAACTASDSVGDEAALLPSDFCAGVLCPAAFG